MSSYRTQLAELWQECANITRKDIFGPYDKLRPKYCSRKSRWQIDVTAVGMVGKKYRPGGLTILSVNPAGGKADYEPEPDDNRMYKRLKRLRNATDVIDAFKKSNRACSKSYPHWGSMTRFCDQVLEAVRKDIHDIAFLHVVPFRTKDDKGYEMLTSKERRSYLNNGYNKLLKKQLDTLSPERIVAMDKPSNEIALKYKYEVAPDMAVTYYTRGRGTAHGAQAQREKTLRELSRMYSGE